MINALHFTEKALFVFNYIWWNLKERKFLEELSTIEFSCVHYYENIFWTCPFIAEVVQAINGTYENLEEYYKSDLIIPVLASFKSWIKSQSNRLDFQSAKLIW